MLPSNKYTYSVIRFVPDPITGEFINIGILVGSDEQKIWKIKTVQHETRAKSVDRYDVWKYVREFVATIDLDDDDNSIESYYIRHRNIVQFSKPCPASGTTIEKVVEDLFDIFVYDE